MSTEKIEKNVKAFGDRLRELRLAKGWTLEELARRIDVRHSTIGNWENYNVEPVPGTLAKLAAIFDTTVSYLLHGEITAPESAGELRDAVEHWKTRALKAEQERDQIKAVIRSAAGNLAEIAGESTDIHGKPKAKGPKASSVKSALDQAADQVVAAAEERAAELRRQYGKPK